VTDGARRLGLVLLLLAVFVGIAVVDRVATRSAASVLGAPDQALATVRVAPPGVESAAWYCAGGTSSAAGASPTLLLANTAERPVSATIDAVAVGSSGSSATVTVPAHGSAKFTPSSLSGGTDLAATVQLDGGGVGVWEEVYGPAGWSVAPCASAAATQWYFAHGSTATGDSLGLALYNPGETVAVVDISLSTSTEGTVAPAAYQGIDLPAHALVVENVGDHVQNDPAVAMSAVALSGSFVAYERQTTGQSAGGGMSLLLGTPTAATVAAFAQSTDVAGGSVTFDVFDPGAHPATVSAVVGLDHGSTAPFSLTVPAGATAALATAGQTRVPSDTPFSMVFSSSTGIVVGRAVGGPSGSAAPQVGITGATWAGARRWVVPEVPAPGSGAWYLAVADLARGPVTLRVLAATSSGFSAVSGVPGRLSPGQPVFVGPKPGAPIGAVPLEIEASGPVAVQLDVQPAGAPGVVVIPALALG